MYRFVISDKYVLIVFLFVNAPLFTGAIPLARLQPASAQRLFLSASLRLASSKTVCSFCICFPISLPVVALVIVVPPGVDASQSCLSLSDVVTCRACFANRSAMLFALCSGVDVPWCACIQES